MCVGVTFEHFRNLSNLSYISLYIKYKNQYIKHMDYLAHSYLHTCLAMNAHRKDVISISATQIALTTWFKNFTALTRLMFHSSIVCKYLNKPFLPCAFRFKHEISYI